MKRFTTLLLASLAFALATATSVSSQVLRLKTGRFVIGNVEEANEDGLRVRRLDNGGTLRLEWSDIAEMDVAKLRKRFNLLDDTELEDVLFRATSLTHMLPTGRKELIGELILNANNYFLIRKKGQTFKISVDNLRGTPSKVDVPIHDVLLPDEIYQRKLDEVAPAEDANKHLLLAAYLIRVGDYARAKLHLEKSKALGGGDQPREVDAQLERVVSLEANKAEADLIRSINVQRNRKRFAKALELCADYETKFGSGKGKLGNEFAQRKLQLEKDRTAWLTRKVTEQWYRLLLDEAGRAARTMTQFESAQEFAEEEMGQRIRQRVAKRFGITPEEAEALFRKRIERGVASAQSSTYSTGSWILGASKITEGTQAGKAKNKNKKGAKKDNSLQRQLDKRLQEWMRRARRANGGANQQQGQELQTEDEWWKDVPSSTRKLWITSYYVENAGDMELVGAYTRNCPTCGGRGTIAVQSSSGNKVVKVKCPTCHGTQFLRVIRYR